MRVNVETLNIEGMSCGHCVRAVREALEEINGVAVRDVQIGTAEISYDPHRISHDTLEAAIKEAGYTAKPTS